MASQKQPTCMTHLTEKLGIADHLDMETEGAKSNCSNYIPESVILAGTMKSWATRSLEAEKLWQLSEKACWHEFYLQATKTN